MASNRLLQSLTLILFSLCFAVSAHSAESIRPGGCKPLPPPFNFRQGEGRLLTSTLVTTYATGASTPAPTSAEADPAVPDLDTYYLGTICPTSLDPADCAGNELNLNTAEFGNFDLGADPIANNPLGIKEVDAVKVTYGALNVGGVPVTVSGGIVIPELPPASLKGIVLYFHGTTLQRSAVPSNFITAANPDGNDAGMLLGALWASQGYIVVMPDYIGLGDDTADPHPYVVYPDENAQSGLAMVNAARAYLLTAARSRHFGFSAPLFRRLPLFITGYSEGGAYALDAARLMQSNPGYALALNAVLKDVVPISGAFDLTGTMLPYLFDNITVAHNNWFSLTPIISAGSKPALGADIALSFAAYQNIVPTDILVDSFYTCTTANLPDCGTSGNLDGLFYEADISDTAALLALLTQATDSGTGWSLFNNPFTLLITAAYAEALQQGDTSNPLYAALLAADTYKFNPDFPLALVSLQQDSVVTRINTDVAYSYFTGQNPLGPYQEFLVANADFLTPPLLGDTPALVDHLSELPFLAVLALHQFNLN